jgi:hypothetical protein
MLASGGDAYRTEVYELLPASYLLNRISACDLSSRMGFLTTSSVPRFYSNSRLDFGVLIYQSVDTKI